MSDTILEVRDLVIDIPVAAGMLHPVQSISFEVKRGETLCIVGESGCGKSLTSLAIMDLLPKAAIRTASALKLDGEDLQTIGERRMSDIRGNKMSMIFQEPMTSLNPAYTIGNQLTEALRRHKKVSAAEARDRAIYLLEKVGITAAASRLTQYPHQLSGGLRQRVMIAMALMCGPEMIIADEPTTALDVTIQAQILHLLADLQKEFNMGMILITHDLGVVSRVADRVAVMYLGEMVETCETSALDAAPWHPYTEALLSSSHSVDPDSETRRVRLAGSLPKRTEDLPGCPFASRCPRHLGPECDRQRPPRRTPETGHDILCHIEPEALRAVAPIWQFKTTKTTETAR